MSKLADAAFQRPIGNRRLIEPFAPDLRQPQLQPSAIVGVRLTINQPGANQRVDGPADGGRAPMHMRRDLVERPAVGGSHCREQIALLAERLGRSGVPAELLHEPGEARRERAG